MIAEAQNLIDKRSPLAECEAKVREAQNSLGDDLSLFFRNVELYRDGVFSHTTKESISTLGIGGQLDSLERNSLRKLSGNVSAKQGNSYPVTGKL
jgi:hypothetical protein